MSKITPLPLPLPLPVTGNQRVDELLAALHKLMAVRHQIRVTPDKWLLQELAFFVGAFVAAIYPDDPTAAVDNFADIVNSYIEAKLYERRG
jgi:hypothetical protein